MMIMVVVVTTFAWSIMMFVLAFFVFMSVKERFAETFAVLDLLRLIMASMLVIMVTVTVIMIVVIVAVRMAVAEDGELDNIEEETTDSC